MATTLCEECYPGWGRVEILTIGAPLTPCAQCGRHDQSHKGGLRCHLFRSDPREAPAIQPIDEAQQQLARRLVRHNDAIVMALIRDRLPQWKADDLGALRGRLEGLVYPSGVLEYVLDGMVIARFHPPTTERDGNMLTVDQRYQVIE